jgi:signal transduction histidine kinase/ligand-binding sensor domain-containing protein/DNA-binding response OmpR family regulator
MKALHYFSCIVLMSFGMLFTHSSSRAQIRFDKLTSSNGLSQSTINQIFQDQKGFLWFTSADGLNRYDGYEFTVFRHQPNTPNSLSNSDITCITQDRNQNLWIGTRTGGINLLDYRTGQFKHLSTTTSGRSILNSTITALALDKQGNIWACTYELGLLKINPNTQAIVQYSVQNSTLPTNNFQSVLCDSKGDLWFGSQMGHLLRFSPSNQQFETTKLSMPDVLTHNRIVCLYEDRKGRFWVGTYGNGLHLFDRQKKKFQTVLWNPKQLGGINAVTGVCYDRNGRLWIGTDYGLLYYPSGELQNGSHFLPDSRDEYSLISHAIKSVIEDQSGNIWIGMWEAGINVHYANKTHFKAYVHRPFVHNSPLASKIVSLSYDAQDGLWICTAGQGVSRMDTKTGQFEHFSKQNTPSLLGNDINTSQSDGLGRIYLSVWNEGFAVFDAARRSFIPQFRGSIFPKSIFKIVPEHAGTLLVSSGADLWRYDPNTQQAEVVNDHRLTEVFNGKHLTAIIEDPCGGFWLGTFNHGLCHLRPNGQPAQWFRADGRQRSLNDNHIYCLYLDAQQNLWIGTNGGGLSRLNTRTGVFGTFTDRDGLPSNTVKSIIEDNKGYLWLSTNNGISCFDPRSTKFKNYNEIHGLPSREFLANACTKSPRGQLFFGSMNGVVAFDPDSIRSSSQLPPIYITGFKLFNKPVVPNTPDSPLTNNISETSQLALSYSQSVLTFDFLALSFQRGQNNQYAYLLEGFDPDWNFVGTKRSATYTNLDPGMYKFRVKAANADGVWNPKEAQITLIIKPPFYKTWWAYGLYAACIVGLLLMLRRIIQIRESYKTEVRIRELEAQQMRELDLLKTNFFTNISHEFRTPVTLILSPLEKILAEQKHLDARLLHLFEVMHRNAMRVLRLINQLLDISKLEAGSMTLAVSQNDLVWFCQKITHSFNDVADDKRICLVFETNTPSQICYFDPDVIEKVLYNLVSNALKFTPEGGRIVVKCTISPNFATLQVSDSGIGISPEHCKHIFNRFYQVDNQTISKVSGTGIGLALAKELVELHRGMIEVSSQVASGTTFQIKLPITAAAFPAEWIHGSASSLSEARLSTAPAHEREYVPLAPQPYDQKAPLLLIAEDNDELRAYLHENLQANFQVAIATNGHEGLQKAIELIPDLIISDLTMPIMDGITFCEGVKSNEKTSHIPFILLTSHHRHETRVAGLNTGADDYITKPFNIALLEARIHNLIASRKKLRETFGRSVYLQPSAVAVTPSDEHFLTKAIAVVEQNFLNPKFDVEALEDALNMSKMQLYRKLKSLTDCSANDFIRQIRLKRAAQLLRDSDLPISEVAYAVGIQDPAYFARIFKKTFGKAPSEFNNQLGKVSS